MPCTRTASERCQDKELSANIDIWIGHRRSSTLGPTFVIGVGLAVAQRQGQKAETSASVLEMLNQARAAGRCFSHTERVLRTACEFWVAVVNSSLDHYLAVIPKVVLRDAEAAFAAIEIPIVADILRDARINPLMTSAPGRGREIVARLQRTLNYLNEPVDDLIRKFAVEQTWSRLKRPTFVAIRSSDTEQAAART